MAVLNSQGIELSAVDRFFLTVNVDPVIANPFEGDFEVARLKAVSVFLSFLF